MRIGNVNASGESSTTRVEESPRSPTARRGRSPDRSGGSLNGLAGSRRREQISQRVGYGPGRNASPFVIERSHEHSVVSTPYRSRRVQLPPLLLVYSVVDPPPSSS